jgi:micrococcal nuclease
MPALLPSRVSGPRVLGRTPQLALAVTALASCLEVGCAPAASCGPERARVERVIDGDTVEISGGERVRYLLIDTPETTSGKQECFGADALEFNRSLVEGRIVELAYASRCRDRFGRLLAYVTVGGLDVNARLVADGYACVLHVPPDGDDRVAEFSTLEGQARLNEAGLWGACPAKPCGE